MIKLFRRFPPLGLTPAFVLSKTEQYKVTREPVWNVEWLKDALKELSYGKCAYCECSLTKESNYMEVEHFEDKKHNPDKVLEWDNLLPSCKHCNGHKSTHDVVADPIVNPFIDNPGDYLYFQYYRYKARNTKGENTIAVLELNDGERMLVDTRFKIGNALQDSLSVLLEKLNVYKNDSNIPNRNKLMGAVHEILRQCQPESEYAALCATVLHSCDEYQKLKADLKKYDLWTEDLETYDSVSRGICLFK